MVLVLACLSRIWGLLVSKGLKIANLPVPPPKEGPPHSIGGKTLESPQKYRKAEICHDCANWSLRSTEELQHESSSNSFDEGVVQTRLQLNLPSSGFLSTVEHRSFIYFFGLMAVAIHLIGA